MPIENESIVGAVNELVELFKKQQVIMSHALNSNQLDNKMLNKDREEVQQINAEFEFISNFIFENITVEDSHRYIGKMLLNARQQADEILKEAAVEVEKMRAEKVPEVTLKVDQEPKEIKELLVTEEPVVDEVKAVVVDEVVQPKEAPEVLNAEVNELSVKHLQKTEEIHNKYKESLDSILKEIDDFLER